MFCKKIDRKILKAYHPELPQSTITEGHIQSHDFIHWIQDGHSKSHWLGLYHTACNPCAAHYDYIVKLETQTADAAFIGPQLNG